MPALALLLGNVTYTNLPQLDCCSADVAAMHELLAATQKFTIIDTILDAQADVMRERIRSAIANAGQIEEIFFYFTGHGVQSEDDFYFCAANFDSRKPNETGLSTDSLHQLLRIANAELVVKVIDACNSGTLLIKDAAGFSAPAKHGFKDLVQISSCLDSQNALTGSPLSVFTEYFRRAALRKTEGTIYYTDIIATLRDEFLNNANQTPHFVYQSDAREVFVDEAACLNELRAKLSSVEDSTSEVQPLPVPASMPTLLDLVQLAEERLVHPDTLENFTTEFFDHLSNAVRGNDISTYFDCDITQHASYEEATAKAFVARVLSRQKRVDNFVTAEDSRKSQRNNPYSLMARGVISHLAEIFTSDESAESWTLRLNCKMDRAQVRISLTPKYLSLKKIVAVVTCAPSLDSCYIFEVTTQHSRRDFTEFDAGGSEISTRWWQLSWTDGSEGVVEQIAGKLYQAVQAQLDSVSKRLQQEEE